MDKIELIKQAIFKANISESDLPKSQFNVTALTSLKIRHLLNNLGKLGTKYLECGVHKGGTFTATVADNSNLKEIYAVDSFESDNTNADLAKPVFIQNADLFIPQTAKYELFISDTFQLDLSLLPNGIDHYLYDGGHSQEEQRKALTYYYPILADEFIFMCDDYDWEDVQKGTQQGIKDCNLEILFETHLVSEGSHDNDSWWNGFYVSLLKKNK